MAIALAATVTASAQKSPLTFGAKTGLNLSNSSAEAGEGVDKKTKIGFQLGITADYAFNEALFLQSGLSFTTKGMKIEEKYEDEKYKSSTDLSYLQLPVYIGYKINATENTKIVFNAGPYFAYGLSAKLKADGEDEDYNLYKKYDGDNKAAMKRFDLGIGLGAGVEFGKAVVGLNYELGLANLDNADDGGYKNRNFAITIGFKF